MTINNNRSHYIALTAALFCSFLTLGTSIGPAVAPFSTILA
ncbi:hypothetical protein [Sphingorhabdus lutea]|nr:hypothetical protein [Sphingorhabdus lutea]